MSLNTAAVASDFETLRRSREGRPSSSWRRWFSWRRIEWALRWTLGIAPVAVTISLMEYGFMGMNHDWSCVAQHLGRFAYAVWDGRS